MKKRKKEKEKGKTKEEQKMEKDLNLLRNGKIDKLYLGYDIVGQEKGVERLALEFPWLFFCISLKRALVEVRRKEDIGVF